MVRCNSNKIFQINQFSVSIGEEYLMRRIGERESFKK